MIGVEGLRVVYRVGGRLFVGLDVQIDYPQGLAYSYPYTQGSPGTIAGMWSLNLESPKSIDGADIKYYDIKIFYSNRYNSNTAPPNDLLKIYDTLPYHGLIAEGSSVKTLSYSVSSAFSFGASMLGLEAEDSVETTVGMSDRYIVPTGIYISLNRELYCPQEIYTATDINKMQSKMCIGGGYCRLLAQDNNWKLRYMGEIEIKGKSSYIYSIPSLGIILYSNNEEARYVDSRLHDGALFVVVYAHYSGTKWHVTPVKTNRMVTYILGDDYPQEEDCYVWYYPVSYVSYNSG